MKNVSFYVMPIGLLYPNMNKLNKILEIESILYNMGIMYNVNFNFSSFISEWKDFTRLNQFKSNNELLNYNINKYMPNINIDSTFLEDTLKQVALNYYIGSYYINIATFQYLSEKLWPDLLQTHTYVLSTINKKSDAYYELEFEINEILKLYNGMKYTEAVNEFINDLGLFITYNILGKINLNEEPILSNDILRLKLNQFIF